jgi:glycosyltransferase involved in cell wall biosynthesis
MRKTGSINALLPVSAPNFSGRPLVSIGVPVFNAERFLTKTLRSLLDQSLGDLELIISDNASTDGTRAICEEFARHDPRVRYIRQPVNIGAPRNWNIVVHEAQSEFFRWASASDICPPYALERCVEALRSDPSVVLCYGRTQFVDEHGRPLEIIGSDIDVRDELPSERFSRICTQLGLNNAQSGVFRLDVLNRTRLDRLYPSGDLALMAELALYGKFCLLPEVLLFRRQSRDTASSMLTPLERQRLYDPRAEAPMKLIGWRRHLDNMVSIARAPISVAEKLRTYRVALRLARWDRGRLWRELLCLCGMSSTG